MANQVGVAHPTEYDLCDSWIPRYLAPGAVRSADEACLEPAT